jgi:hypothetical protein
MIEQRKYIPQQTGYFDKFLADKFQHIDESIRHIDQKVNEIKTEVDGIKADNKATRWWVVGTGIAVIFGIATIFFSFAQLQNSWMQQVFSFVGKMIVK